MDDPKDLSFGTSIHAFTRISLAFSKREKLTLEPQSRSTQKLDWLFELDNTKKSYSDTFFDRIGVGWKSWLNFRSDPKNSYSDPWFNFFSKVKWFHLNDSNLNVWAQIEIGSENLITFSNSVTPKPLFRYFVHFFFFFSKVKLIHLEDISLNFGTKIGIG